MATSDIRPRVYDIEEVAGFLGVSKNHAYRMAHQGKFPVIRLGRRFIVPIEAFDRWFSMQGPGETVVR